MTLVDGRQLAWEETGDPDGSPVLMFHGTPGSRFDRDPFGSPTGVRLITPDRPGYGLSSPHPGRRVADWPNDVTALLDHLGIDRCHVLGISGGGPHALACAALLPQRVSGAAIACGLGPTDWDGALEGMMPSNIELFQIARTAPDQLVEMTEQMAAMIATDVDALLDATAPALAPVDRDTLADPQVRAMMRTSMLESVRQGGRAIADDQIAFSAPWGFDLGEISVPVVMWHGDLDVNVPVSHARRMASMIPTARLTLWPDDGHMSIAMHRSTAALHELLRG